MTYLKFKVSYINIETGERKVIYTEAGGFPTALEFAYRDLVNSVEGLGLDWYAYSCEIVRPLHSLREL